MNHRLRIRIIIILLDHLLIMLSFILVSLIKGQHPVDAFLERQKGALIMLALHFITAVLFDKYNFGRRRGVMEELMPVVKTNISFTAIASILQLMAGQPSISRLLFFGTVAVTSLLELLFASLIVHFRQFNSMGYTYDPDKMPYEPHKNGFSQHAGADDSRVTTDNDTLPPLSNSPYYVAYRCSVSMPNLEYSMTDVQPGLAEPQPQPIYRRTLEVCNELIVKQAIIEESGQEAYDYINRNVPLNDSSIVLSTNSRINILHLRFRQYNVIVNLRRINDHGYINKFFEAVNSQLPVGGLYVGCCYTLDVRKSRIMKRFSPLFGLVINILDYFIHRVAPKLNITQKLYFFFTKGKNRVLSRTEVLGRLYSCGFTVLDEHLISGRLYFVARKMDHPAYDLHPSYGPLIKLNRVGRDGKVIGVYKFRTMYPYAEYLQHYVHVKNKLAYGGKFQDDFRVNTLGGFMRRLWLDELPMLVNLFRGELKLVGVRPLSQHYLRLYPAELQEKRQRNKPGLIPPYYADMPKDFDEIVASEMRYLEAYEKHPLQTDLVYIRKALINILFRGARSN